MFIVWEAHQGENALLPMKLLTHRTQIGACLVSVKISSQPLFQSDIYWLSSQMLLFVCFVIGTVRTYISYSAIVAISH